MPTLVELAGAKLPTDRTLDGRSFLPQVLGRKDNPREPLQAALNKLNPAGGILDQGDGTGRHANRENCNRKKRKKQQEQ